MREILSQREIDSLLKTGPEGPAEETVQAAMPHPRFAGLGKTVKRYDFRRPDKFSKEQLRSLQAMHETFARLAASVLANQMRSNVEIRVSSIEQGLYEEYVAQVAASSFLNVMRMTPLAGSVLLEYGQELGLSLVDRLLGGSGAVLDQAHEITEIDVQLLRGVATGLATSLAEAWENLSPVQPMVTDVLQDVQFVQLAPPSEVVIQVFMEVSVLDMVAGLSICTPYSVLEPVIPHLNAQAWAGNTPRRGEQFTLAQGHLRTQLERTPTTLRADLGATDVRAAELARLRVGDVIRLSGVTDRPIPVRLGPHRKWLARPGLVAGRVSIELVDWAPAEIAVSPSETTGLEDALGPEPLALPTLEESEAARAA